VFSNLMGFGAQATPAAANDQVTFAPPDAFSDWDLIISQNTGGSAFTVTVDGQSATATQGGAAMTCNAGSQVNRAAALTWPSLANTTHSIVINTTSAANMYIQGITTYPNGRGATSGIGFIKMALLGQMATSIFGTTAAFTTTGGGSGPQTINAWAPSLVIVELGGNDMQNAVAAPLYQLAIGELAYQCSLAGASVLFYVNYAGTGATNQLTWPQYVQAIYAVAQMYNCAVYNSLAHFGTGTGLMNADNLHPNDAGHALNAAALLSIL
jgi:hypothetical protein